MGITMWRAQKRCAVIATMAVLSCAAQAQLNGAGSSLARALMQDWSTKVGAPVGGVTYEPSGSGAGFDALKSQSVDFALIDIPQTDVALSQVQVSQYPVAGAGIAVMVNLPQLGASSIKLSAEVLADIYAGAVRDWNHASIQAINKGTALPAVPIVPIWRSDASGSSYVLSTYLARGSNSWRRGKGVTYELKINVGQSVKGGAAVVKKVTETPGAIGYEGVGTARASKLPIAQLKNASGAFVAPEDETIRAALQGAKWSERTNAADLDGSDGARAYPMSAVVYAVIPNAPRKGKTDAGGFFQAALSREADAVRRAGFVAIPEAALKPLETRRAR